MEHTARCYAEQPPSDRRPAFSARDGEVDVVRFASAVGLKCGASREAADEWLLRYPADASVMAYIGRSWWNTLRIGGGIPDDELIEAIDGSYAAVVSKLAKKDRPARALPRQVPG